MKKILLLLLICTLCTGITYTQENPVEDQSTQETTITEPETSETTTPQTEIQNQLEDNQADESHDEEIHAAGNGHGDHPEIGSELPLWSIFPFAGILLSIAFFPLIAPHFWHHHFPKISAGWGLLLAIPFLFFYQDVALYEILHIYIADYIPFIILLWSLYTISGGILLTGTLVGTPMVNTTMLLIGTILASWMGTTGAAMLMIRPFLRANKHRKNRTFMVVFFIFLVANIGGSLTPLGDPPLFLGFLHSVPFFWTFNLLPFMLFAVGILLVLYFIMDSFYYTKEAAAPVIEEKHPLRLHGAYNFLFLAGVVSAVLMSGTLEVGEVNILGVHVKVAHLSRDIILIMLGIISLKFTPWKLREDNEFTWFPIKEVAYLFAGIFVTMVPCLLILKAGANGAAAPLFEFVQRPDQYFWVTGILSSFLDNAPTYLTFFNTALGSFYAGMPEPEAVKMLIENNNIYLEAIACGAVFFGANTYIGNAPNFMVRSIAEDSGTPMPSFFGYFFMYSVPILFPIFILISIIFF